MTFKTHVEQKTHLSSLGLDDIDKTDHSRHESATFRDNYARLGPSTRYRGSKRKLAGWLAETLEPIHFHSAMDLMAGTGSVSYLLKSMGKQVVANDILHSNYMSLLAVIQNSKTILTDQEVDWLLERHHGVSYSEFIQETFANFYYKKSENAWLDMIAANIEQLPGGPSIERNYKQAISRHALVQACLMKRPFNLFHRKNLYIRTANVHRSFGNKTTWETPFVVLFRRMVQEANSHVFCNGQENHAMQADALCLRGGKVDLLYIDPPYFRSEQDRAASNYRRLYHFVEGLVRYSEWPSKIDVKDRLKALKEDDHSSGKLFSCKRENFKEEFLDWFQQLLDAWPDSKVLVSYKRPGIPSQAAIKKLIERTGRLVSIRTKPYKYALNHMNGAPNQNIELLFLGT